MLANLKSMWHKYLLIGCKSIAGFPRQTGLAAYSNLSISGAESFAKRAFQVINPDIGMTRHDRFHMLFQLISDQSSTLALE